MSNSSSCSTYAVAEKSCFSPTAFAYVSVEIANKTIRGFKVLPSPTNFELQLLSTPDNKNLQRHVSLQHPALQIPHISRAHVTRLDTSPAQTIAPSKPHRCLHHHAHSSTRHDVPTAKLLGPGILRRDRKRTNAPREYLRDSR